MNSVVVRSPEARLRTAGHASSGVPAGSRPSPVPAPRSPASDARPRVTAAARRRARGVTLLELAVTLAIVAVLAGVAYSRTRAAPRNIRLAQAADELAGLLAGLRSVALAEGKDHLLVVSDAPENDASKCADTVETCAASFVLAAPKPSFSLSEFKPTSPGELGELVASEVLPRGARFYLRPTYKAPPAPFSGVAVHDGTFLGKCANGARCFAVRFTSSGVVEPVTPSGGTAAAPGFALVLASDAELEGAGGDHRGVLVGFPAGVVKSWAYAP